MAAKPKLSPEQWASVRAAWEADAREGYTWLVKELELPVSAPAVRKTAVREGWGKKDSLGLSKKPQETKTEQSHGVGKGKVPAKVSKVSEKESETNAETIETLPMTTAEAIELDPDKFGVLTQLTDKQEAFVREYMVDWNATQAAIRAGYSAKSAGDLSGQLLRNPRIREGIEALASARARRLGIDSDELLRMWAAVLTLDANELTEHRRVCCPYCWGENHQKQYTPAGLEKAKGQHDRERERRLVRDENDDIGEFPEYADIWYDKRKEPHPDCPECFGEGWSEVFMHDTRKLSPAARLVYAGVKEGREGIEILTLSKEKAADNLARALGLFKERETEVNINMVSGDELYRIYEEKMRAARDRQRAVLEERGLIEDAGDASCDGGGK